MSQQKLERDASQPDLHSAIEVQSALIEKPTIVGIYGIPGSGKTFLLNELKQELGEEDYEFYEGSQMIDSVVPGGLTAFQKLSGQDKAHWRRTAIQTIANNASDSKKAAIVAGHFMFWPETNQVGDMVCTGSDLKTYTHILYLNVPAECIAQRRSDDTQRHRESVSIAHLQRWQQAEITEFRTLCLRHGILFSLVSTMPSIARLLRNFRSHTEAGNLDRVKQTLDILVGTHGSPETALVMDADRTLAAEDTGTLFWKTLASANPAILKHDHHDDPTSDPLKSLFSTASPEYSYASFRQAALMYEEATTDLEFDAICETVASNVTIHPEFVSLLLRKESEKEKGLSPVIAIIVTCGLSLVWQKILAKAGLSEAVHVIGGGRLADNCVVTPSVKAAVVSHLRDSHHLYVFVFGDSPLDLDMLHEAHKAVVVVGEEHGRSKSMDKALQKSIDSGLKVSQVLLPPHAPPRLNTTILPSVEFTDESFIESILRPRSPNYRILHATDRNSSKILMTPMRDAKNSGPGLRESHRRVGWYLSTEFVTEILGPEEYPIPHVQGHDTTGYRLAHEEKTTIVALMRGGEPMALGVSDAFPSALFVHATRPTDLKRHLLKQQHTVLLVDSVINSGRSIVEFIRHIRSLDPTICIVVVAGVIQEQSLSVGPIYETLKRDPNVSVVGLRISSNKYTGQGGTDTGNRLFNTTHLP